MRLKILITVLAASFVCTGCAFLGVAASPTASEKKVPAEFDISAHCDGTILVLVNQPAWGNYTSNLRPLLTEDINTLLRQNVKIRPAQLVSYRKLAEFRGRRADFYSLSPVQVGAALNAKIVLFVDIPDYKLYKLPASGYYEGSLTVTGALFDVATGLRLWPAADSAKQIKVGFEAEAADTQTLTRKLTKTAAHCLVRYLYHCPKNKFKIWGEKPDIRWQNW